MSQSVPVNGSVRRIYLYWILLLVPTLVVGAGALWLLQREQGRLAARAGQVDQARRASLEARARLSAENVELIVGDVENGLLDSLAEAPSEDLAAALDLLQKNNPLVRSTFLCEETGSLLRPGETDLGEQARGFRRRYAALLQNSPPWNPVMDLRRQEASERQASKSDLEVQSLQEADEVESYASNVARARRDVQALSKGSLASAEKRQRAQAPAKEAEAKDKKVLADSATYAGKAENRVSSAPAPAVAAVLNQPTVVQPERRGWYPVTVEGRLALLAWVQPAPSGPVRGLELELSALVSRLGASLPPQLAQGEGLCLRDERGRVLHQVGLLDHASPALLRVPVNSKLLPGWMVEAQLDPGLYSSGGDGAFLLVSGLLVGTFVVAILAGGSLLLLQARRSALDSVQKTSFVANVSHELKTPLTTIRLYAELLEQGRVASEERRLEYLRTIGRETERLARLVNNVLDFSRLEQGRKALNPVRTNLVTETDRLAGMLGPRAAEAGMRLELMAPEGGLVVLADPDALGQIVLNLADNAFKYAASGGELKLVLAKAGPGLVRLSLLDRGPGVPAALRERVFEKFYRMDDSLTAEKAGAGLGLSIARQLARAMGGELECLPREGGGAEFRLSLPEAGA